MSRPGHVGTIHENIKREAGKHALSLSRPLRESLVAAPLPEAFDLDLIASCLNLDGDEASLFSAVWLDGLSLYPTNRPVAWVGGNTERDDRVSNTPAIAPVIPAA